MELVLLADHEQSVPLVAKWYVEQWGYLAGVGSFEEMIETLQTYLNRDDMPLMVLAKDGDEFLGVAQLKFHEMDMYPEKEHWLGGVYVCNAHRGKGLAEAIINEIIRLARQCQVKTLYLQTENLQGGLYKRLGWQPIEQVNNKGAEVLVMEKAI